MSLLDSGLGVWNSFPTSSRTSTQSFCECIRNQLATLSEILVWLTMERCPEISLNRSSIQGLVSELTQITRASGWSELYLEQKSKASCVLLSSKSDLVPKPGSSYRLPNPACERTRRIKERPVIERREHSGRNIQSEEKFIQPYPVPPSPQRTAQPSVASFLSRSKSRPGRWTPGFRRMGTRKFPILIWALCANTNT